MRLDKSVGIGNVCDLHVLPVEFKFLAGTDSDVAHEREFGEGAGVVEVCARSAFASAGVEPAAVVSLDARQGFARSLIGLHLGFGDDAGGFRPATAQDSTLCADVEDAIITKASACFQLHRSWGHKSTFVPGDAYRSHTGTGREMEVYE